MRHAAPTRRARRQRRRRKVLLAVTVLAVVVAGGAGVAAFVVRRETVDVQAQAVPVHARVRDLVTRERNAEGRLTSLRTRAAAVTDALGQLFAAEQAQVAASNHAVDVANEAVARYNRAEVPTVVAAFQGADATVTELQQQTDAVQRAAAVAQHAVAALRGKTDG